MKQASTLKAVKVVASAVAFIFTFTTVVWSTPSAISINDISTKLPTKDGINLPSLADSVEIPNDLGLINERYSPGLKSSSSSVAPLIVHIQDAHGNYQAQLHIKEILEHLAQTYDLDLVFLEGGIGKVDPNLLRFFKDDQKNLDLANVFVKEGLVGGAEIFLLKEDSKKAGKIGAYGVEEIESYRKNLEAYREVYSKRQPLDHFLKKTKALILTKKSHVFNKALSDFFKEWMFYQDTSNGILAHLKTLEKFSKQELKVDLSDARQQLDWPELVRIVKLRELETELKGVDLTQEKTKLLRWAERTKLDKNSLNSLKEILENKAQNLQKEMKPRAAVEHFYEVAAPKGFSFKDYPNLSKYFGIEILKSELNSSDLFGEIEHLTARLLDQLAKTKEEKELLSIYQEYLLLTKLFMLELERNEFVKLKEKENDVKPSALIERIQKIAIPKKSSERQQENIAPILETKDVDHFYEEALNFYEIAHAREQVMFEKMLSKMKETGKTNAILVTGGFHSEGLKDQMKEKGISYVIVAPRISELTADKTYEHVMTLHGLQRSETSQVAPVSLGKFSIPSMVDFGNDVRNYFRFRVRDILRRVRAENTSISGPAVKLHGLSLAVSQKVRAEVRVQQEESQILPPSQVAHWEARDRVLERERTLGLLNRISSGKPRGYNIPGGREGKNKMVQQVVQGMDQLKGIRSEPFGRSELRTRPERESKAEVRAKKEISEALKQVTTKLRTTAAISAAVIGLVAIPPSKAQEAVSTNQTVSGTAIQSNVISENGITVTGLKNTYQPGETIAIGVGVDAGYFVGGAHLVGPAREIPVPWIPGGRNNYSLGISIPENAPSGEYQLTIFATSWNSSIRPNESIPLTFTVEPPVPPTQVLGFYGGNLPEGASVTDLQPIKNKKGEEIGSRVTVTFAEEGLQQLIVILHGRILVVHTLSVEGNFTLSTSKFDYRKDSTLGKITRRDGQGKLLSKIYITKKGVIIKVKGQLSFRVDLQSPFDLIQIAELVENGWTITPSNSGYASRIIYDANGLNEIAQLIDVRNPNQPFVVGSGSISHHQPILVDVSQDGTVILVAFHESGPVVGQSSWVELHRLADITSGNTQPEIVIHGVYQSHQFEGTDVIVNVAVYDESTPNPYDTKTITERIPLSEITNISVPAAYGNATVSDLPGDDYRVTTASGAQLGPTNEVSQETITINSYQPQHVNIRINVGPSHWYYDASHGEQLVTTPVVLQSGETAVLSDQLVIWSGGNFEPMETIPAFVEINGEFVPLTVTQAGSSPIGWRQFDVSFAVPQLKQDGTDRIKFISVYGNVLLAREFVINVDGTWTDVTSAPPRSEVRQAERLGTASAQVKKPASELWQIAKQESILKKLADQVQRYVSLGAVGLTVVSGAIAADLIAPKETQAQYPPGTNPPATITNVVNSEGPVEILSVSQRGNQGFIVRKNGADQYYDFIEPATYSPYILGDHNEFIIFNHGYAPRLTLYPLVSGLSSSAITIPSLSPFENLIRVVQLSASRWWIQMSYGDKFILEVNEQAQMTVTPVSEEGMTISGLQGSYRAGETIHVEIEAPNGYFVSSVHLMGPSGAVSLPPVPGGHSSYSFDWNIPFTGSGAYQLTFTAQSFNGAPEKIITHSFSVEPPIPPAQILDFYGGELPQGASVTAIEPITNKKGDLIRTEVTVIFNSGLAQILTIEKDRVNKVEEFDQTDKFLSTTKLAYREGTDEVRKVVRRDAQGKLLSVIYITKKGVIIKVPGEPRLVVGQQNLSSLLQIAEVLEKGLPPVPEGWTRAASNPNFAFQAGVEYYYSGVPFYTINLLNLTTGEKQVLTKLFTEYYQRPEVYDVSPDGTTVIYDIISIPRTTTSFRTVYIQRIKDPTQQVAIDGELQSIAFDSKGNVNIVIRDFYPSGTVLEKTHTVKLHDFQITTSLEMRLITQGGNLHIDQDTPLVIQPEFFAHQLPGGAYIWNPVVFIYDASSGLDHLQLLKKIEFPSASSAVFTFTDAYTTPNGRQVISVGLFYSEDFNIGVIIDPRAGTELSLGASINSVAYNGSIATYTILNQSGTTRQVIVDLNTLTIIPFPDGWKRAASNPNFAFQSGVDNLHRSLGYVVNLITGLQEPLYYDDNPYTQLSNLSDISPDGHTAIYQINSAVGPLYSSVFLKRIFDPVLSLHTSISGELRAVTFDSDHIATLTILQNGTTRQVVVNLETLQANLPFPLVAPKPFNSTGVNVTPTVYPPTFMTVLYQGIDNNSSGGVSFNYDNPNTVTKETINLQDFFPAGTFSVMLDSSSYDETVTPLSEATLEIKDANGAIFRKTLPNIINVGQYYSFLLTQIGADIDITKVTEIRFIITGSGKHQLNIDWIMPRSEVRKEKEVQEYELPLWKKVASLLMAGLTAFLATQGVQAQQGVPSQVEPQQVSLVPGNEQISAGLIPSPSGLGLTQYDQAQLTAGENVDFSSILQGVSIAFETPFQLDGDLNLNFTSANAKGRIAVIVYGTNRKAIALRSPLSVTTNGSVSVSFSKERIVKRIGDQIKKIVLADKAKNFTGRVSLGTPSISLLNLTIVNGVILDSLSDTEHLLFPKASASASAPVLLNGSFNGFRRLDESTNELRLRTGPTQVTIHKIDVTTGRILSSEIVEDVTKAPTVLSPTQITEQPFARKPSGNLTIATAHQPESSTFIASSSRTTIIGSLGEDEAVGATSADFTKPGTKTYNFTSTSITVGVASPNLTNLSYEVTSRNPITEIEQKAAVTLTEVSPNLQTYTILVGDLTSRSVDASNFYINYFVNRGKEAGQVVAQVVPSTQINLGYSPFVSSPQFGYIDATTPNDDGKIVHLVDITNPEALKLLFPIAEVGANQSVIPRDVSPEGFVFINLPTNANERATSIINVATGETVASIPGGVGAVVNANSQYIFSPVLPSGFAAFNSTTGIIVDLNQSPIKVYEVPNIGPFNARNIFHNPQEDKIFYATSTTEGLNLVVLDTSNGNINQISIGSQYRTLDSIVGFDETGNIVTLNLQRAVNLQIEQKEVSLTAHSVALEGNSLVARDQNNNEIGRVLVAGEQAQLNWFSVVNRGVYFHETERSNAIYGFIPFSNFSYGGIQPMHFPEGVITQGIYNYSIVPVAGQPGVFDVTLTVPPYGPTIRVDLENQTIIPRSEVREKEVSERPEVRITKEMTQDQLEHMLKKSGVSYKAMMETVRTTNGIFGLEVAALIGKAMMVRLLNEIMPDKYRLKEKARTDSFDQLTDREKAANELVHIATFFEEVPDINDAALQVLIDFLSHNKLARVQLAVPGATREKLVKLQRQMVLKVLEQRATSGIVSRGVNLTLTGEESAVYNFLNNQSRALVYAPDRNRNVLDSLKMKGRPDTLLVHDNVPLSQKSYALLASINSIMEKKVSFEAIHEASAILELLENVQIAKLAKEAILKAA